MGQLYSVARVEMVRNCWWVRRGGGVEEEEEEEECGIQGGVYVSVCVRAAWLRYYTSTEAGHRRERERGKKRKFKEEKSVEYGQR